MGGYSYGVARRHNLALTSAFMAANWNNGSKTRLQEMLVDPDDPSGGGPREAQTPDQHIGALDAWVIATGGELGGKPKKRRRRKGSVPSPE